MLCYAAESRSYRPRATIEQCFPPASGNLEDSDFERLLDTYGIITCHIAGPSELFCPRVEKICCIIKIHKGKMAE